MKPIPSVLESTITCLGLLKMKPSLKLLPICYWCRRISWRWWTRRSWRACSSPWQTFQSRRELWWDLRRTKFQSFLSGSEGDL